MKSERPVITNVARRIEWEWIHNPSVNSLYRPWPKLGKPGWHHDKQNQQGSNEWSTFQTGRKLDIFIELYFRYE